jgi:phosphate-selective porin
VGFRLLAPCLALSIAALAATSSPVSADEGVPSPASPTAGYHNGTFFVRSEDDVFRFYVQGRVHADWTDQLGPGVSSLTPDQALKNGFFLRRARLEVGGEFFERWQWQLGAEFAPSSVDNPGANQASLACSVNAASAALACTNRENPVENASVKPAPTDAFVNFAASPWANVQVGQYYLPFSLENRISDNTTPFLERSLVVRGIGAPNTRDIGAMFWGESPDRLLYYAVAIVNGDGPNRPNADNRYDLSGRAFVSPFVHTSASSTKFAQFGASVRYGSRDSRLVGYDMPALTTQDGFAYWRPTYRDSQGNLIHIMPSAEQWAVGGDVFVPLGPVDLTAEFIYATMGTREAADGYQLSPFTQRVGTFSGYGYYAQIGWWVIGDHDIVGYPSYGRPIHVDLGKPQVPAAHGVELLAKLEQMHLQYSSAARGGTPDPATPDGTIDVTALELGVNYWATRHLRVGLNYAAYVFPNSEPVTASGPGGPVQTSVQRAIAPAQLLSRGVDGAARDGAHEVHELSFRVGVQF